MNKEAGMVAIWPTVAMIYPSIWGLYWYNLNINGGANASSQYVLMGRGINSSNTPACGMH